MKNFSDIPSLRSGSLRGGEGKGKERERKEANQFPIKNSTHFISFFLCFFFQTNRMMGEVMSCVRGQVRVSI